MNDENLPVQCHPRIIPNQKTTQKCDYCPENKCLLDCQICNPKLKNNSSSNC